MGAVYSSLDIIFNELGNYGGYPNISPEDDFDFRALDTESQDQYQILAIQVALMIKLFTDDRWNGEGNSMEKDSVYLELKEFLADIRSGQLPYSAQYKDINWMQLIHAPDTQKEAERLLEEVLVLQKL